MAKKQVSVEGGGGGQKAGGAEAARRLGEELNLSGISLDRLRSFLRVVHAGSIVDAAQGSPAKQALYSRQMTEIQQALELPLFVKDGRYSRPNDSARRLAAVVTGFFEGMAAELAAHHDARTPMQIGCGDAVTHWIIGPGWTDLIAIFSNYEFNVVHGSTNEILQHVRSGKFHIGIVHDRAAHEGLEAVRMQSLEFGLYYPAEGPDYALAKVRRARAPVPIVSLTGSGQYVRAVEAMAGKLDTEWTVVARLSSLPMLGELAAAARSCAFLPLDAEPMMQQRGFRLMTSKHFADLSRCYCAVYDPRVAGMQPVLRELAHSLRRRFPSGTLNARRGGALTG
jgi:DNA-binding transcriptional LysR family regulator